MVKMILRGEECDIVQLMLMDLVRLGWLPTEMRSAVKSVLLRYVECSMVAVDCKELITLELLEADEVLLLGAAMMSYLQSREDMVALSVNWLRRAVAKGGSVRVTKEQSEVFLKSFFRLSFRVNRACVDVGYSDAERMAWSAFVVPPGVVQEAGAMEKARAARPSGSPGENRLL